MADTKLETVKAAPAAAKASEVPAAVEAKSAKAPKKAKEAAVKEEPKKADKPAVTEALAFARDVRVTPRKVRLVIDLVRGKDVSLALGILGKVNRAASQPVVKLIQSAAANAVNNFGMSKDLLYIAEIQAADGVRIKRFTPRAKGSASPLIRRNANIRVVVKERK
jgi:large subunit ribosomal protein L22